MTNRIIKFRAWDKKEKKWLLGYEYPNLGGFSMFGEIMMMNEYASLLSSYFSQDRLDDIVLMQFTGLLDKNGKEIYEGDIVAWQGFKKRAWQEVKYDVTKGILTPKQATFQKEIEVIGNIYEKNLIN